MSSSDVEQGDVLRDQLSEDIILQNILRPEKQVGERVRLYNIDADSDPYLEVDDHGIILQCPRRGYFLVHWFNESCADSVYKASQLYSLKRLEYDESREE